MRSVLWCNTPRTPQHGAGCGLPLPAQVPPSPPCCGSAGERPPTLAGLFLLVLFRRDFMCLGGCVRSFCL